MSKAQSKKEKKKSKKSSVRHTRAVNRARSKSPITPPPDEKIKDRLSEILQPAIEEQKDLFKQLGLRSRVLTLSVMVAIVISALWSTTRRWRRSLTFISVLSDYYGLPA